MLGVAPPRDSIGRALLPIEAAAPSPLVFVIPAYNEEANLPAVLASIHRTAPGDHAVVVVDDGSRDGTARVAEAAGAIVVRHEANRGLGAALRTGLATARGLNALAAVYLDADGEYDAGEAGLLLEPIERGEADYVLGSRFKGRSIRPGASGVEGMSLSRRIANYGFSILLSFLCGRRVSDGQTGFRAFSRRALDVAEVIHDYNYAQVLTLDLLHKGMRMREIPISYHRRTSGKSFISPQYLWRVPFGIAREMLSD
jgi:glycosyltransferase involved in cell wall biosynthesis